jgi:hypothetical protein
MKLPFRTYEIPGALLSGFLTLAACEAGYDGTWLIEHEWSPERISRYGAIAFGIGLVIASVSRRIVEEKFVAGWLNRPEELLLGCDSIGPRDWRRAFFPRYCAPLADSIRDWILQRRGVETIPGSSGIRRISDSTVHRNNLSFHLYTTCRTLCLGLFLASAILATGIVWHTAGSGWGQAEWRKLGYCLLSLFEAVGMLYRYLKHYRQHTIESLTANIGDHDSVLS